MTAIKVRNASVEIPIYDVSARSLKKAAMRLSVGGRLGLFCMPAGGMPLPRLLFC